MQDHECVPSFEQQLVNARRCLHIAYDLAGTHGANGWSRDVDGLILELTRLLGDLRSDKRRLPATMR